MALVTSFSHTYRIQTVLALVVISLLFGSAFVFAAAPSGGYHAGDTLDPQCAPGDVDCFVVSALVGVNLYGENPSVGFSAPVATGANAVALGAGSQAIGADSLAFGTGALAQDTTVAIGKNAGLGSDAASSLSLFFGEDAGNSTTNAMMSSFIGWGSGSYSTDVYSSSFIGSSAGSGATNVSETVVIGSYAGDSLFGTQNAVIVGRRAGQSASNLTNSILIGHYAGANVSAAPHAVFIGNNAGNGAVSSSNSIFIGNNAGLNDVVDNTSDPNDFSILIGPETGTGSFSNSIALGSGVMNTADNQFMVGSIKRPISEMRIALDSLGGECVIDVNGAACSSDETLKTNVEGITNALSIVSRLEGVTYHWNADTRENPLRSAGFIAQNAKSFVPEAVTYNENTGKYLMNYTQLIPYLVEAIKELRQLAAAGPRAGVEAADLVVSTLRAREVTTDTLCVGTTCITESDLQQLLDNAGIEFAPPTPKEKELVEDITTKPLVLEKQIESNEISEPTDIDNPDEHLIPVAEIPLENPAPHTEAIVPEHNTTIETDSGGTDDSALVNQ